jgi:hypothetical protein
MALTASKGGRESEPLTDLLAKLSPPSTAAYCQFLCHTYNTTHHLVQSRNTASELDRRGHLDDTGSQKALVHCTIVKENSNNAIPI